MRNLRKLSYVACAVFFFTSCEETYNDKLFWPGEISQEYGSYIKPYTLDLTYSGEKLIGKTVSFKTEDSETGTLTLNNRVTQKLTSREAQLLLLLYKNQNRMIPRIEILQHFWPGDDPVFSSRSLDVFISKLRKYLSEDQSVKIVNERGKGLRLLTDN